MRLIGILVACSTPITGFLCYALAAILFGEDRLEGADGLTKIGLAVMGVPLAIGAGLVVWSFVDPESPSRRSVAGVLGVAGVAFLAVGLWAMASAGADASIGAGLLIMASLPLVAVAVLLLRSDN